MAKAPDPFRIQVLDAQRIVALRPLIHRHKLQDALQPARHPGVAGGLDVGRKVAALVRGVVIQAVDPRVDEANHVLGSGGLGLALVLGAIELADQLLRRAGRQRAAPQPERHPAGSTGHSGALHEPAVRLQADHHHGARRRGIQGRNEGLVDPAAGQRQTVRNAADERSDAGLGRRGG